MTKSLLFAITLLHITLFFSCQKQQTRVNFSSGDSLNIINEIIEYRSEQDSFYSASLQSPFIIDTTISYNGLNYFEPNLDFYFQSRLYKYENPEMVIVLGTKGEEREQLKYGYFKLNYEDREYKINVYKFSPSDSKKYKLYKNHLSVWFRDKTSGKETYKIGRYVNMDEENENPYFVYTIDLNKAYNPYCAYSPLFSCAIPRDEDYLDIEVRAGEKKYK